MLKTRIQATPRQRAHRQGRALLSVYPAVCAAALLSACASGPTSTPPASTGAAGGGTSVGGDASLQTCPSPVGVVRLQDSQASADTQNTETASNGTIQSLRLLLGDLKSLGPKDKPNTEGIALESLRLLIQQSNCLVIADRGRNESAASDEKRRTRGNNEVRDDANMGGGQEVAADFVLRATVLSLGTDSSGGFSGGGFFTRMVGGVAVKQSVTGAKVQLVLSDVRAKVQLAVAQGEGSGKNTGLATSVLGRVGSTLGAGKMETNSNTSSSTVVMQAFADAYNKLVPALRDYKTQSVRGGLGAGGTLGVQGGKTESATASK